MPSKVLNYRELLETSKNLPSLPAVVNEALRLLHQKGTELSEFERCLKHDPPLVAKMLRVVNSPVYGLACRVTSIKEAIMVLGFRSLGSLILAASCAEYLERDFACYGYSEAGLWLHSIATAAAARKLADILGEDHDCKELVFIAGLLRDIGKLLLAPFLQRRSVMLSEHGPKWTAREQELFGMDYHEAGSILLDKWNLDGAIVNIVADRDDYPCPDHYRVWQAIVRLADLLACEERIGFRSDVKIECDPRTEERTLLGLSADKDWEEVRTGVSEAMDVALQSLRNLSA